MYATMCAPAPRRVGSKEGADSMLVLSRQRDETIMIGDDVEITVVDIRGDKVRLGITAPSRVAVHRKEVYDAIRVENEQAARAAEGDIASLGKTGTHDRPAVVRPAARLAPANGSTPARIVARPPVIGLQEKRPA